jgi:hypothetical protein
MARVSDLYTCVHAVMLLIERLELFGLDDNGNGIYCCIALLDLVYMMCVLNTHFYRCSTICW